MKITLFAALLLTTAMPAYAQVAVNANDLTSVSGSDANANSGSVSGASSDNANVNAQVGNIGVSENTNTSTSQSGAISGSNSESESNSNSDQDQGQSQGQSMSQGQEQQLDAAQANQQGVTFNQTWNTRNRKTTEVRTNNAVPLTSSSSFSSDFCGGTVSGGVSAAPLGISVGGAGTKFDKSCQSLRRAEKAGMLAANYQNMGQPEMAMRAMSLMAWAICVSDSAGTSEEATTAQACLALGLLGLDGSPKSAAPAAAPQPRIAQRNGHPTPEAVAKSLSDKNQKQETLAAVSR